MVIALAAVMTPRAIGQITLVSDNRDISAVVLVMDINGFTTEDSETASPPFGQDFDDSVRASAVRGASTSTMFVSQESSIGAALVDAFGFADGRGDAFIFEAATGDGLSLFDIVFDLDSEIDYTIDAALTRVSGGASSVELRIDGGATIERFTSSGAASGVLPAGRYRLIAKASAAVVAIDDVIDTSRASFVLGFMLEETCEVDFNGDGVVDFFDVVWFLTLYAAADPSVDYTGDGILDFFDVVAFLVLFNAGCP